MFTFVFLNHIQTNEDMTIRHASPGLEKQLYVAPGIEELNIEFEQTILTGSPNNPYGAPGEDPDVNYFGEF